MNLTNKEILNHLNQQIVDNIESIAQHFDFKIIKDRKHWTGACPVHRGDNQLAFNVYHAGAIRGNWACRTHACEKEFSSYPLGLIQGLLSNQKGWDCAGSPKVSFMEAVNWCNNYFNNDENIKLEFIPPSTDCKITNLINAGQEKIKEGGMKITKEEFRSHIKLPSAYYLKRGFKADTLEYFDVGDYIHENLPMSGRAIVPVYDPFSDYVIGCSGRTSYDKCVLCKSYHSPTTICPSKDNIRYYSKWKHSQQFPSSKVLYNYSKALEHVKRTGKVILVEGLGSVWKLHEAGFPMAMAMFGIYFSENKKRLLDKSGAMDIIIVRDTGEAGENMMKNIIEKCSETHNIYCPEPNYKDDIGECSIDHIKKYLEEYIEN